MITTKDLTPLDTTSAVASVRITTAQHTAVGEVLAIHDRLLEQGAQIPTPLTAAVEQLRQAVRLEAPLTIPLMNVRVLDRTGHVTAVRTLTIPAICPSCGGPRSQDLVETHSWIHGIKMTYDRWTNPCGHTDMYEGVLVEARRFNKLVRGGA